MQRTALTNPDSRLFVEHTDFSLFEPEVPPAPVRTIAITPEILAEEARKQQEREAAIATDWKIKATLSEENLRRVRVQVAPGRHVVSAPKATKKLCACGAELSEARAKQCKRCFVAERKAAAPAPKHCEDCGKELTTTREGAKYCGECRYKHVKPHSHRAAQTPVVKMETPTPSKQRRTMAKFVIKKPVAETEAPAAFSLRGRVSEYLSLFGELKALRPKDFLPITVEETKSGVNIGAALRKMAEKDGKALEQRTSSDRLTFYFRIIDKPEQK